ncbi:MAG: hypothetical protein QXP45_03175, partial [Thermoproteota archaeon]
FLLMVFIPWSIIAGNLVEYVKKTSVQALLTTMLIVFFVYFQTIPAFMRIGPVISSIEYEDLLSMRVFVPANSIVASPGRSWRYWVEYILKSNSTVLSQKLVQEGKMVYLIVDKGSQHPDVPSAPLYEGRVLKLYILRPKFSY